LGAENPPDDFTTRLLHAEVEGERLSETAVRTQLMFLIIAGNETTRNLIGLVLRRLAQAPEMYAALRSDPSGLDTLIDETLRFDAPVQLLARTCTKPIELDGVQIEVGDRVLFSVASADRDAAQFEAADEFRLDRARPRDHVGFGAGPHICPGAFLARLETRVSLEEFMQRVASFHVAPGEEPSDNPVFWAHGPSTLRVVIEAA
jgi:cytochrome P450